MQTLLQQIKIDDKKLKQTLNTIAAKNFSGLSSPCYFPPHKEMYHSLLYATKVTETDVKQFVRRTWSGRKEAGFKILNDPPVLFLIFLMYYFLNKRDMVGYRATMYVYMIRFYSNLAYKSFPYGCKQDVFKQALNILTKTHLFVREKSISNAIHFLSTEMERIWTKDIKDWNLDRISKFIQDSRTRISQSLKSFAETYYRISGEGGGIGILQADTSSEDEERGEGFVSTHQDSDPREKLIDPVLKKIVLYRTFDEKAFENSKNIAKGNELLCRKLAINVCNLKYSTNIKLIYKLFLKDITSTDYICGKKFYERLKNLMIIKRTKSDFYFKKEVQILVDLLIKDNKLKEYSKLNIQTQFSIAVFMATYLMLIFRNTHCNI